MASYPHPGTLRATTPPLYYHRPEGSAPAYYTVPTRDLEGLRIPLPTESRGSVPLYHPRSSASMYHSTDRSSTQRPPLPSSTTAAAAAAAAVPPPSPRLSGYAMPAVVNPYATTEASYAPPPPASATGAGRWSYQMPQQQQQAYMQPSYPTVDPLTSRLAALEAEEGAVAAEEMTLRAALAELQATRRRQEEEQLRLSRGWADMLAKEERYYTEPMVDRRPDIMAREQQCAMLHDRLQQAEAQAHHTTSQLAATDYILREAESFEQERKRVQEGFQDIERRRRECVAKAERYFDVETKRVVEGNKCIRKLDVQLREMTRRGPLAQLQGGVVQPPHRSSSTSQSAAAAASRMVTFAPDKSIILDLGREESEEAFTGASGGGMTNSYANTYDSTVPDFTGVNEEEIGGTSIAFSFNDAKDALLAKRHKTEIISA